MLIASTSRVRLPQRGGTRLDEARRVPAQRGDDCSDLLRRRRHERKAVGIAPLVIPLDEIDAFRHVRRIDRRRFPGGCSLSHVLCPG